MGFGGDGRHQAADALEDVDGRIVSAVGQFSAEDDVPVEERAGTIGDGVIQVVAFGQDRQDAGDASVGATAEPFNEPGHCGKDARTIPLGGRRFTGGQSDFPLCLRKACERIHHKEDIRALVAEVFGDGDGCKGRLDALDGSRIGSSHDNDASGKALRAEAWESEIEREERSTEYYEDYDEDAEPEEKE